jgi:hypothetical protein
MILWSKMERERPAERQHGDIHAYLVCYLEVGAHIGHHNELVLEILVRMKALKVLTLDPAIAAAYKGLQRGLLHGSSLPAGEYFLVFVIRCERNRRCHGGRPAKSEPGRARACIAVVGEPLSAGVLKVVVVLREQRGVLQLQDAFQFLQSLLSAFHDLPFDCGAER